MLGVPRRKETSTTSVNLIVPKINKKKRVLIKKQSSANNEIRKPVSDDLFVDNLEFQKKPAKTREMTADPDSGSEADSRSKVAEDDKTINFKNSDSRKKHNSHLVLQEQDSDNSSSSVSAGSSANFQSKPTTEKVYLDIEVRKK